MGQQQKTQALLPRSNFKVRGAEVDIEEWVRDAKNVAK
jgi:hypothetical protein